MGYIVLLLLLFFLDQWTKVAVVNSFALFETKPIFKNIFHLTYVQNKGAAFSILENQQWLFITITIISLIIIVYYFLKLYGTAEYKYLKISLILIASGALGNLVDRIRLGYVIDFFDFRLINFAIFNVADICVVVGAFLMGFLFLFIYKDLDNKSII